MQPYGALLRYIFMATTFAPMANVIDSRSRGDGSGSKIE